MEMPSVLPKEVIPIDRPKKRKLSTVSERTGDGQDATRRQGAGPSRASKEDKEGGAEQVVEDDASDEDDQSLLEDILDLVDSAPENLGFEGLSSDESKELHSLLRQEGVNAFLHEVLIKRNMDPRAVGMAFGLDHRLDVDDETYLQILAMALFRAEYKRQKLQQFNTIDDAATLLQRSRNIMVITGAGISTSLGIPDFRSKGTGFYDKVRDMGYDDAEEVFEIHNFDDDPSIFYSLAGDILPDLERFSPTHAFIRLLQDHGRLQTNYTQNIDNLEALAGIDTNKLIHCHGSFATATCRKCRHQVKGVDIFQDIREKRVAYCKRCIADLANTRQPAPPPKRSGKLRFDDDADRESGSDDDIPQPGVMKPDITFFGEKLSDDFFQRFIEHDAKSTDLVVVIGTSLKVAPVSEMPNHIPHEVPHIYISREPIRHVNFDVQLLGGCDDIVAELCRRAGWSLTHEMIPAGRKMEIRSFDGSAHRWMVVPTSPDDGKTTEAPAIDRELPTSAVEDKTPVDGLSSQSLASVGSSAIEDPLIPAQASGNIDGVLPAK